MCTWQDSVHFIRWSKQTNEFRRKCFGANESSLHIVVNFASEYTVAFCRPSVVMQSQAMKYLPEAAATVHK